MLTENKADKLKIQFRKSLSFDYFNEFYYENSYEKWRCAKKSETENR